MNDDERLRLMEVVLPAREPLRARNDAWPWTLTHLRAALHPLDAPPAGRRLEPRRTRRPAARRRRCAKPPCWSAWCTRSDGWQVLLTRRTDALRHHARAGQLPGRAHRTRATRDAIAAALRESREEIGLAAAQVAPLGFLDPLCTITGFRVLPVVALVDPEFVARARSGRSGRSLRSPARLSAGPGEPQHFRCRHARRPIPADGRVGCWNSWIGVTRATDLGRDRLDPAQPARTPRRGKLDHLRTRGPPARTGGTDGRLEHPRAGGNARDRARQRPTWCSSIAASR